MNCLKLINRIIIGYQEPGSNEWKAKPLTRDHKPENADEMQRIKRCGGKVVSKSGKLSLVQIKLLNKNWKMT